MPFINKDVVNYLGNIKEDYEILIPKFQERLQPLCAIYKKKLQRYYGKRTYK